MSLPTDFAADLHVNWCRNLACTRPPLQHRTGVPGSDTPTALMHWVDGYGHTPFAELESGAVMTREQATALSEGLSWLTIQPGHDELWQIDPSDPADYGPSLTVFRDGMVIDLRGEAGVRPIWVSSVFYGLAFYRRRVRMIYDAMHRDCVS